MFLLSRNTATLSPRNPATTNDPPAGTFERIRRAEAAFAAHNGPAAPATNYAFLRPAQEPCHACWFEFSQNYVCGALFSGWIDAHRGIGHYRGGGEEMQCSAREGISAP